jgi:hypothetical protein
MVEIIKRADHAKGFIAEPKALDRCTLHCLA